MTKIKNIEAKAEQGDAEAQYTLGHKYLYEKDKREGFKQAVKWFKKGAQQGHTGSQRALGAMYYLAWSGQGVQRGSSKLDFISWWRKAARKKDRIAQYSLGLMYNNGHGVPQDDKKAIGWWKKAAKQGSTQAQHALGFSYDKGIGVPQDYKQAVHYYELAAKQGYELALSDLADMYEKGRGVPQDEEKAAYWRNHYREKIHEIQYVSYH